jgi:hypothetical protein
MFGGVLVVFLNFTSEGYSYLLNFLDPGFASILAANFHDWHDFHSSVSK